MPTIRTKRRRVRQLHPDVLRVIREDLLTGASAPEVARALSGRQARGEFPGDSVPSERTISNIAREMRGEETVAWGLNDADPATVGLVLRILQEVSWRTEGRIGSFTKAEGRLLPVIYRAMEPRWTKLPSDRAREWQAYVWTRFYLSWVRDEQDEEDAALMLAAMQADQAVPITQWFRIERVLKAAQGWLPPELLEMRR